MFTILMKDVDGRKSYRYFEKWTNAERELTRDVAAVKNLVKIVLQESVSKMNHEKGFYEREETLVTDDGLKFHYALLNGYFEDQ